jgi:hypothetical protein
MAGEKEWSEQEYTHGHADGNTKWGIGIADMAYAIRSRRPHRASGQQAMHVLDAMHGFLDAAMTGHAYPLKTPYERPAPLPTGLPEDALDD